ncbi:hypothetical protein QG37_06473 [Candidozyma auris]|nr:hypothetical protein QG37_06473 [[Candida] auris]
MSAPAESTSTGFGEFGVWDVRGPWCMGAEPLTRRMYRPFSEKTLAPLSVSPGLSPAPSFIWGTLGTSGEHMHSEPQNAEWP